LYYYQQVKNGDSVRVLGKLKEYDLQTNTALLEHNNWYIKVDTTFLENFPCKINSLFQFIGEIINKEISTTYQMNEVNNVAIKARVGRNIDGMDVSLYEKALAIRRNFENSFNATT